MWSVERTVAVLAALVVCDDSFFIFTPCCDRSKSLGEHAAQMFTFLHGRFLLISARPASAPIAFVTSPNSHRAWCCNGNARWQCCKYYSDVIPAFAALAALFAFAPKRDVTFEAVSIWRGGFHNKERLAVVQLPIRKERCCGQGFGVGRFCKCPAEQ